MNALRERFEPLNPWRDALGVPFLKLEKENFGMDGEREQLYTYCISTKLYCLYNLDGEKLLSENPPAMVWDSYRHRKRCRLAAKGGQKMEGKPAALVFEAWHFILSREFGLPHQPPRWLKQPAVMAVPVTTPQALERLGCFKDVLRPFTVVMVPFPQKEVNILL